jgi:hypothetical protein
MSLIVPVRETLSSPERISSSTTRTIRIDVAHRRVAGTHEACERRATGTREPPGRLLGDRALPGRQRRISHRTNNLRARRRRPPAAPTGGSGVARRETASGSARARGGGRGGAGLTLVWACCGLQVVCCGGPRRLHLHKLHSCTEMKVHQVH